MVKLRNLIFLKRENALACQEQEVYMQPSDNNHIRESTDKENIQSCFF